MPRSTANKTANESSIAANSSFAGRANSRQRVRLNKAQIKEQLFQPVLAKKIHNPEEMTSLQTQADSNPKDYVSIESALLKARRSV